MRTGLTVQTFYGHLNCINDAVFSIGGQFIATCDSDGILKTWDIRMVQEVSNTDIGDVIAHCCAFDKTGKYITVGCSDGELKVFSVDKGEVVSQIKAHEGGVSSIHVNQENNSIFTTGGEGKIRVWK